MALTFDQFVQEVADSGLMSEEELRAYLDGIPEADKPNDGEALAKKLVADGKLTPFQAQSIWKKRGKSLTLGNYVVSEKLGQGGMGMVFKASHRLMKREVALKVLPSSVSKDKSVISRFLREVEAAAKLTHPNIVAAYDADESPQGMFLIMEYVEGRDLQVIVKKQGAATVKQTIDYILQAARGLEYAHKNGVIHRDIKPANLLLDKEGTVKILDMGLARFEESADVGTQAELTGTGMIMGTVDYMSPEQALNTKAADARADIYSLGMTLFYMLSAKPAYEGDTITARLLAHQTQPIPNLREVAKNVPHTLETVFQKMVAKQANDRYQAMTEVIADLESIQAGDVPSSDSPEGIQPVAAARSEDSAINSFLGNLDGGASASDPTVATADTKARKKKKSAEKSGETMASSVGDITSSGLSKTEAFTQALKQPKQRNLIIGGTVAAVLLLGAIIWGIGGGEPEQNESIADQDNVVDGDKKPTTDEGQAPSISAGISTKMIWEKEPHCTYTDLIRFKNRWFCVFREARTNAENGKLRIISSEDGERWSSKGIVGRENFDLRDPHLSAMPDGTLLSTAASHRMKGREFEQGIAKTSADGSVWSDIIPVGEENWRFSNVAWQGNTGYSIAYNANPPRKIHLYKGETPGSLMPYVQDLNIVGQPSEAALLAMDDGRLLAVLHRGGGKGGPNTTAMLGSSSPPYQQWTWNDLETTIAGPSAIQLTDGRIVVGGRFEQPTRTSLCWLDVDDATLTEFQALPSGGETGYPGIVEHDGMLWVSYYSSHEGNAKIYLSKLPVPKALQSSLPTIANVDLTRGLVGHWNFEEGEGTNVVDSSGKGNHGTLAAKDLNAVWSEDAPPVQSAGKKCITLMGSGDNASIPSTPLLEMTDAITISAWAKIHRNNGYGHEIVGKAHNDGIRLHPNGALRIAKEDGDAASINSKFGNNWPRDEWIHMAGTYDGNMIRGYMNGELAGETRHTEPMVKQSEPITFGQYINPKLPRHVSIDDIRIYNRALNEAEIQVLAGKATSSDVLNSDWDTAIWALTQGARIFFYNDGQYGVLLGRDQKPRAGGRFELTAIAFGPGSTVHDEDLIRLAGLRSLEMISFYECELSDQAVAHLLAIPNLTRLQISVAEITNKGAEQLAAMSRLTELTLAATGVTDEALKAIARLPHLKLLDLDRTRITDAGLEALHELSGLKEIDLFQTGVTANGARTLHTKIPGCSITYGSDQPIKIGPDSTSNSQAIDLLALLDPERDFLDPRLKLENGKVVSPAFVMKDPNSIVMIPYKPVPEEYDVDFQLERKNDEGASFNFGILMDGTQANVAMDGGRDPAWALEYIDGMGVRNEENPTRNPGRRLVKGKVAHVKIRVRKGRVATLLEGETIFDWTGRREQLTLWEKLEIPDEDSLFFFTQAEFIVHKMTLTPVETSVSTKPIDVPLDELNTNYTNGYPWVSPDGMRIYWCREGTGAPGGISSIWTAERKDAKSPFENIRQLLVARHVTLSGDELEVVVLGGTIAGVQEPILYSASRTSRDQPFPKLAPIESLRDEQMVKSPSLTSDGLTLVFQRKSTISGQIAEFAYCTRTNSSAGWSSPQALSMQPIPNENRFGVTWPSLSNDRLTLWLTKGGQWWESEVFVGTRKSVDDPFGKYQTILKPDGTTLKGRGVNYIPATNELFYSVDVKGAAAPQKRGVVELRVIKNFRL